MCFTAIRKVPDHQSKPRVALVCWLTTAMSTQKNVSGGSAASSRALTSSSNGYSQACETKACAVPISPASASSQ